jgi:uncharacterized protein with GYD domain
MTCQISQLHNKGEHTMATFISTIKFTDQGIKNIQDTCKRAQAVEVEAEKMGIKVIGNYWTRGPFDGVLIMEAPDEVTATALMLQIGSLGNVQTQTTRAFQSDEMKSILAKV